MPRIFFLNRYFHPDHSATSQILSDLAFHLAATGRDIHVVTSQQIYDDPAARLPSNENVRGVQIHRVATTRFGRSNLIGRGFDYLSFYWSMWRRMVSLAKRGDIIVAKTDPPLLSALAIFVAKRRSSYLVNWLQDLYPEIAIELGVPFLQGPLARAIVFLRNRSLRLANANVVLGTSMAARVRACGVAEDRIHVIPNWTNDQEIVPIPPAENPLRREWKLEDKFVVGYSGNLGRAHEFETVLAAAERLREDLRIVFVLIGGGKQFDELTKRVRARKLEQTFRFFPYQDRAVLKYSLCVPDVHWISLRPRLEGLIFPSKFYGIAAAGRPMIAITANGGEIAELIERHGCGIAIEPGDADSLSRSLAALSLDPLRCAEMGQRAREMLDAKFSRRQAIERWQSALTQIAQSGSISTR
jgi:glycosyltransferase involved in cell wall biosynthesis